MEALPEHILTQIALYSPQCWRAMLTVPRFARHSRQPHIQHNAISGFIICNINIKCTEYRLCGRLHNVDDHPAIISCDGNKEWYQFGVRHRDSDLPAILPDITQWNKYIAHYCKCPTVIYSDNTQGENHYNALSYNINLRIISSNAIEWYQHGKLHRDNDKPAIIHQDGTQIWYQYGQYHRDKDCPAIIYSNGAREWYQHGKLHRDNDQPAVIWSNGTQIWYQNDMRYRIDNKPIAIEFDGTRIWY